MGNLFTNAVSKKCVPSLFPFALFLFGFFLFSSVCLAQSDIYWTEIGRGQEPSECEYYVAIGALELNDCEITTPWGENFQASDYLPLGWQGEDVECENDDLGIDFEAGTENGARWMEVDWEFECDGSKWNSLKTNDTQLTVSYNGKTWSGTVDFSSSPMPTQMPSIISPADGATNVSLLPEFTWAQWETPGTENPGIWWELWNVLEDEYIYEDEAPADTTTWIPSACMLAPNTTYSFYIDFHHEPTVEVNGLDIDVESYLESPEIHFTTQDTDIYWAGITRTKEPSECEYCVEICALELTDLQIITPWGEPFKASDYLPSGWQGEDFECEDEGLGLEFEVSNENARWMEVEWDFECGGSKWNSLDTGNTQLTVYYFGTTWSGTLDFSSSPMPAQTPNITAPADGDTNVSLLPEFTWEQWENPETGNAGIGWELGANLMGEIYEEDEAPTDKTSWTPPAMLTPKTAYRFEVDFHNETAVQVNGLCFEVESSLESPEIDFTTQDSDTTPQFQDDFEDGVADGWVSYDENGESSPIGEGHPWSVIQDEGNYVLRGSGHTLARPIVDGWTDYNAEAKIKLIAGGFHFNVRVMDQPFCRYFIGIFENGLYLNKQIGEDFFDDLASVSADLNLDTWHLVKIVLKDANIKVYVNGSLKIDYTDEEIPILFGAIDFETLPSDSVVYFDDIVVTPPINALPWLPLLLSE